MQLVFDIKITTKNGAIFCAYLQRDHKVSVILTITGAAKGIEKAHIIPEIMIKNEHVRLHWNWDDPREGANDAMQNLFNKKS